MIYDTISTDTSPQWYITLFVLTPSPPWYVTLFVPPSATLGDSPKIKTESLTAQDVNLWHFALGSIPWNSHDWARLSHPNTLSAQYYSARPVRGTLTSFWRPQKAEQILNQLPPETKSRRHHTITGRVTATKGNKTANVIFSGHFLVGLMLRWQSLT